MPKQIWKYCFLLLFTFFTYIYLDSSHKKNSFRQPAATCLTTEGPMALRPTLSDGLPLSF